MKRFTVMLAILLGWSVFGSAWAAPPEAGASKPETKASPGTENPCRQCHDVSSVKVQANHADCQSCHRDAAVHLSEPMKVKPSKAIASETCLSCHATGKGHAKDAKRMNFVFSEHNKAGVQCSDCHGIHNSKVGKQSNVADLKGGKDAALCATCHQDVLARFSMTSHHPVKEGGVSCTGCHDPHAAAQTMFGGKTEQCTKCHQAVRGPHVFEHVPAAEGCSACHDPHGSPNRRLVTLAQPMLCLQCHSLPGNRHGQPVGLANAPVSNTTRITGAMLRDCTACHSQVHGSSQDQHLRY